MATNHIEKCSSKTLWNFPIGILMKPREIFDEAYEEDSLVKNTENGKVFIVKGRCKDGTYACIDADSREVDLITPSTSYELIEEEVSKYYTPSFDARWCICRTTSI